MALAGLWARKSPKARAMPKVFYGMIIFSMGLNAAVYEGY
jgi:hypothetical protein